MKCWEVWPPIFPFFWKGRLPEKDWLIVPFQKLNSFLFCNFTRLCLSIGMIPAFDLYSLIVPLTTHQPNQPSWNFLGEKPSKIWRFRNSSPGFFELVMRYKLAKRDKKQQNCFISIWLCHKNTALTIGTAEVYFFVRHDPLWPCRPTSCASGTPLGLALEPLGPCRPTPWQPLPTLIVKSCFGNAQIDGTTPRMVPP